MIGLAIRVIKQTLGDKRTLGMIIFCPYFDDDLGLFSPW